MMKKAKKRSKASRRKLGGSILPGHPEIPIWFWDQLHPKPTDSRPRRLSQLGPKSRNPGYHSVGALENVTKGRGVRGTAVRDKTALELHTNSAVALASLRDPSYGPSRWPGSEMQSTGVQRLVSSFTASPVTGSSSDFIIGVQVAPCSKEHYRLVTSAVSGSSVTWGSWTACTPQTAFAADTYRYRVTGCHVEVLDYSVPDTSAGRALVIEDATHGVDYAWNTMVNSETARMQGMSSFRKTKTFHWRPLEMSGNSTGPQSEPANAWHLPTATWSTVVDNSLVFFILTDSATSDKLTFRTILDVEIIPIASATQEIAGVGAVLGSQDSMSHALAVTGEPEVGDSKGWVATLKRLVGDEAMSFARDSLAFGGRVARMLTGNFVQTLIRGKVSTWPAITVAQHKLFVYAGLPELSPIFAERQPFPTIDHCLEFIMQVKSERKKAPDEEKAESDNGGTWMKLPSMIRAN